MSDQDAGNRLTRARLRELQKLKTAAGRREQGVFLIDGAKLVRDALAAGAPVLELLSTAPDSWREIAGSPVRITRADAERLSDTRSPQGDFAVVRDELPNSAEVIRAFIARSAQTAVALEGVQDPGNVGAIIRSAAAFAIDLVLIGPGSADPTHPRVTRAATGAWFHANIARSPNLMDDLLELRRNYVRVVSADADGQPLHEIESDRPTVWLFGNEGSGISSDLAALVDHRAAIPIAAEVESLNVAVAAGIIFHQIGRTSATREGIRPCASPPGT